MFYIFFIDKTYNIIISQIKYHSTETDTVVSTYYYDIHVYEKNTEDDGYKEVDSIGQDFNLNEPDTTSDDSAPLENTAPQCYKNAFLFVSYADTDVFNSDYGTVQNLKVQYGKFSSSVILLIPRPSSFTR